MQHLSWLPSLPSLCSLTLAVDRMRLDLLPPTLTQLTLEGVVHLDSGTQLQQPQQPPQPQQPGSPPRPLITPRLKRLTVLLAKHPKQAPYTPPTPALSGGPTKGAGRAGAAPPTAGLAGTAAPKGSCTNSSNSGSSSSRGRYCVLEALQPLLAPTLTHLSYTATPTPGLSRLDQLSPKKYGCHILTHPGLLPSLSSLTLYVMPKHAWLMDCGSLTPLSLLHSLRSLSLESPLTGATRLARLSQLSQLSQLTRVVTGRLDDEAYSGERQGVGERGGEERGIKAGFG